jgi:Na+-driven multidrug efflux pump
MAEEEIVAEIAFTRILLISTTYFTCGIMDVLSNSLRGLGKSTLAMCLTLAGTCVFRIIYINTICRLYHELLVLYAIYPISWIVSIVLFVIAYIPTMKEVKGDIEKKLLENPV